jgi:transcriptional regulator with XRE-family HTH domain
VRHLLLGLLPIDINRNQRGGHSVRREARVRKPTRTASRADNDATASHTTLAGRIAFLRKQQNLTLDDLAAASGLTKSYLSKVERGLSMPSISTAMKLAASFKLSVGQLLGEEQYDDAISVVRRTRRPSFTRAGSTSGYDYEMLAPGKRFKGMEPFVMRPPLAFHHGRRFTHTGQQMMLVLAGKIELEFGDKTYVLNTGDCAYFDAHVPHRSRSLNNRVAQALVVVMA